MREGIAFVAFTEKGLRTAETLRKELGGTVSRAGDSAASAADDAVRRCSLSSWTAENFPNRKALVFIGAAGIAVRAVAAHLKNKAEDPAVLCVDELGRYVIPLLSGHLGGANRMARQAARILGGEAVLTTATDLEGLFAVDLWAERQGMLVLQPERIRKVSADILRGEPVRIRCPYPISGDLPERVLVTEGEADVVVSYRVEDFGSLQLVPEILVLGIGCRKGISRETLDAAFGAFCRERSILPQAIVSAASIDLKQTEEGMLAFCSGHGWPLRFYSAEALRALEGNFTGSAFVESQVGVDSVCERAACRSGGTLIEKKYAFGGVTFALAELRRDYDWSW